jgi:hypothetical protein
MLVTAQARHGNGSPDYQQTSANLRSRYGIGGVRSATHAKRGILSPNV